jgi:hypothetical protein
MEKNKPSLILLGTRCIYIALVLLFVGSICELLFEPFDGGGGTGAAILPVLLIFLIFFSFLAWTTSRINQKKNWARLVVTGFLAPWSLWQFFGLLSIAQLSLPVCLYSLAALLSLASILLLYSRESNEWMRTK